MIKSPRLIIAAILGFNLVFLPRAFAGNSRLPALPDLREFKETLAEAPEPPEIEPINLIQGALMVAQSGTGCPVPSVPSKFTLKEKVISLTTTFDLKGGGKSLGRITEKIFSLTRAFTYDDASGNRIAEARAKLLSWGNQVIVTDCQGREIGTIKEEIFKSLFKVRTIYKILDARDHEIAKSEKVDWVGTSFTLRDGRGRKVASLERPWINLLSDSWDVTIHDSKAVDPRMIVMIAAFKTSVDNARRAESSE